MKRVWAFLILAVMLAALVPAAAGMRTAPDDKKVIVTNDVPGCESRFRQYDADFYDKPSDEPGKVVPFTYTTEVYGGSIEKSAMVYLPYGYDPERAEPYDILYFYHGTNETPDSFIGDERAKNSLDNMIEVGVAPPFIMVFPTYYYDYENRACDIELFQQEMRLDLMPAVESTFHTWAYTPDDAGFAASRDHRAFSGYSQGCRMCWYSFRRLLDCGRYFLPMSNSVGVPGIIDSAREWSDWTGDYFVFTACGGARDDLSTATVNMVSELVKYPDCFSYGLDPAAGNNLYLHKSNGLHQTLTGRYFLYNAFLDGLFGQN